MYSIGVEPKRHYEREEKFPIHVLNSRIFNGKRKKGKSKSRSTSKNVSLLFLTFFCYNGAFHRFHISLKNYSSFRFCTFTLKIIYTIRENTQITHNIRMKIFFQLAILAQSSFCILYFLHLTIEDIIKKNRHLTFPLKLYVYSSLILQIQFK